MCMLAAEDCLNDFEIGSRRGLEFSPSATWLDGADGADKVRDYEGPWRPLPAANVARHSLS